MPMISTVNANISLILLLMERTAAVLLSSSKTAFACVLIQNTMLQILWPAVSLETIYVPAKLRPWTQQLQITAVALRITTQLTCANATIQPIQSLTISTAVILASLTTHMNVFALRRMILSIRLIAVT
jgi:hypothetical protein